MRSHPRIRKTAKWSAALVVVLSVAAWLASLFVDVGYESSVRGCNVKVNIIAGLLGVTWSGPSSPGFDDPGWSMRTHNIPNRWWFISDGNSNNGMFAYFTFIPLWMLVLPVGAIGLVAWKLDALAGRRARAGLCAKCNYDRTGLAAGAVCPECGKTPA